jgi:DNA invertase Pin-like site-specific DNA recombinase
VLVEDLSRLTRDMQEAIRLVKMAPIWGLRVIGVSDGVDTDRKGTKLLTYMKAAMAEGYLDELKERIRGGLRERFRQGHHAGGALFGYTTKPILDPSGVKDRFGNPKLLGHKLEVRPDQATVVKRIFQEAAAGLSCKEISRGLDRDSTPKPSAEYKFKTDKTKERARGYWDPQMIRSVLTNERYRGLWRWQKKTCVGKDPATGKKIMRPAEEVHEQQREELRLVDDATWNKVQERLAARAEGIKRDPETGQLRGREKGCTPEMVFGHLMNPLNGLLRCAVCGGPFTVIMSKTGKDKRSAVCNSPFIVISSKAGKDKRMIRYMGCVRRHHLTENCENAGVFRLADLEAALGEALTDHFSDARIAAESLRAFQRTLADYRKRLTADEAKAKRDLSDAEGEIEKVKRAILAGMIGETTAAMLRDAEAKQKAATERLAAAEQARVIEPQPVLPQEIVAGIRAQDHRARREAYHRLLSEVRLRSEVPPGRRMVRRWVAEIAARPEAQFKGLPKSLAFGKDFITVGGTASGRDGPRAGGGD